MKRHRRILAILLAFCAVAACVAALATDPLIANAQQINPDVLRALQNSGGGTGTAPRDPDTSSPVRTYRPVAEQKPAPPSKLEEIYTKRAGRPLSQVGYNQLGAPAEVSTVQGGAVQDDYVLGVGDELVVDFRGQENSTYRQRVDRDGRIVLPKLNPILAAGNTLGRFRTELEAAVNQAYVSTRAFVSLGEVHQVSILVTGNVRSPGLRILSGLASPVDAILLSGGIGKSGSLRRVQLIRHGAVRTIDLYALIRGGPTNLGMLRDGDRIFVPTLGPTVAVAGSVRGEGIYELPAGASAISAASLINLAGGPIIANAYSISRITLDTTGSTSLMPIGKSDLVRSGEVIFVDPAKSADLDRVAVAGAVQHEFARPLSTARTTADLFHAVTDLLPTAFTPLGVIVRRDARTNVKLTLGFSVIRAIAHEENVPLQSDDRIYIFATNDLRALARVATRDVNTPYAPQIHKPDQNKTPGQNNSSNPAQSPSDATSPDDNTPGQGPDSNSISNNPVPSATAPGAVPPPGMTNVNPNLIPGSGPTDPRLRAAQQGTSAESAALAEAQALARAETGGTLLTALPTETDDEITDRVAAAMDIPRDMLLHFVASHIVWILDQVHVPGPIAAAEGTALADIIKAAGGAMAQADLSAIEVTSTEYDQSAGVSRSSRRTYSVNEDAFRVAIIHRLDVIRLRETYADRTGETITVAGQVRYPGVFDITRDERLSSVLQRAGGLTEVSYPYGAIFTRRSVAIHEQDGNARAARELQNQMAVVAARPSPSGGEANVTVLAGIIESLRKAPALGRVTVTADPVILASRPDLDVILEPGDAIYIPKRPSSVTVSGEVLNQGAFQFRPNLSYRDYIRMAGGTTQIANDSDTFIVLPDGSSTTPESNWVSFGGGGHIPPGSTIVVPRDLRPFDWGEFIKDATQILSQLAVAAASLSVLGNHN